MFTNWVFEFITNICIFILQILPRFAVIGLALVTILVLGGFVLVNGVFILIGGLEYALRDKSTSRSLCATIYYVIICSLAFNILLRFTPIYTDVILLQTHDNRVLLADHLQDKVAKQVFNEHAEIPFIADIHAHSQMWNHRGSLWQRSRLGHMDFPRLQEANVALQVFIAATKIPIWRGVENNSNTTNIVTLLAAMQQWPLKTWFSNTEKALYQFELLERAIAEGNGNLVQIKSATDLEQYLDKRSKNKNLLATLFAIEGAHAFDSSLENVNLLLQKGMRMVGVAHFHDSEFGGSRHGKHKYGLTDFGAKALKQLIDAGVLLDLSHASDALMDDILEATKDLNIPLVISHTGVRALCNTTRNLDDKYAKAVAARGGVIGVCFLEDCLCGTSVLDIVKTVKYLNATIGEDHIAIGSDMDGGTASIIQANELAHLTVELKREGFTLDQVKKILGGNVLRVLRKVLPRQ